MTTVLHCLVADWGGALDVGVQSALLSIEPVHAASILYRLHRQTFAHAQDDAAAQNSTPSTFVSKMVNKCLTKGIPPGPLEVEWAVQCLRSRGIIDDTIS